MLSRFIVLEGPDGSGTTTHAALLTDRLKKRYGERVLLTAEPSRGPIGVFLRASLKMEGLPPDALQLLFSADRAWHVDHEIAPALGEGKIVVSDRYALSTIAYGKALGLDEQWLDSLCKHFMQPGMQIVLLPPVAVCIKRWRERGKLDILEQEHLQRSVHEQYAVLSSRMGLPVVDSSGEMEAVADQIFSIVSSQL